MYHDQGLIPVKTLAFDEGVNVTLGLPFVRTSPDHGTAFDIAGKGVANPASLIAALQARRPTDAMSLSADGLPRLSEVVAAHGLEPRKALGQNFLFDLNLTRKIARAAGPLEGVAVVEVGPGPGGLTRALLSEGAERVIAVERDARALGALAEIAAHWPGRLEVIEGDALRIAPETLIAKAGAMPIRIVSNLPYNVGTALLTGWLEAEPWPPFYDRLVLMFQREVARRIVATPDEPRRLWPPRGARGMADGGAHPVRRRARGLHAAAEGHVKRGRTHSARRARALRPATLSALTQAAFGQRRKMLRQSLKAFAAARRLDLAALLAAAGLEPTMRAEEVDVRGFVALARAAAGPARPTYLIDSFAKVPPRPGVAGASNSTRGRVSAKIKERKGKQKGFLLLFFPFF